MSETFSAEFYINNRNRLRKLFQGTAPIVITAHGLMQQGGDYTFKFHQDSSFYYLTGINKPEIILVMDKEKEYLILPEYNHYLEVFEGQNSVDSLAKISGIIEILDNRAGWKKLANKIKRVKHVATLAPLPNYVDSHGFYANPARAELMAKLKNINQNLEPLDLRKHLNIMRMVKQPIELKSIQKAIGITAASFKEIHKKIKDFTNEKQIENLINHGFMKRGAEELAFYTHVGAGINACTLHYTQNNQSINQKDLVLIDAGAQVDRYAADITRTYCPGGSPSRRQQQVFDAVLEVSQFALYNLKPGISIRENENLVELFIGEKLRALGLIRNVEKDEIRKYFPHATSHFLGLDVHDGGDYDRPLEAGVVITVEPGIYIPEESIGIRLEDDVLITEDGNRVMSAKLPLEL